VFFSNPSLNDFSVLVINNYVNPQKNIDNKLTEALVGVVATLLTRYRFLTFPAVCFLIFVAFRVYSTSRSFPGTISSSEFISPIFIAFGVYFMYIGRNEEKLWSWTFWLGETLVITLFLNNAVQNSKPDSPTFWTALIGFTIISFVIALAMRGKAWRYAILVAIEAFLAFIAVLAFPIMEMILEEIMKEKLRKIGEKIRTYAKKMEEKYHKSK